MPVAFIACDANSVRPHGASRPHCGNPRRRGLAIYAADDVPGGHVMGDGEWL